MRHLLVMFVFFAFGVTTSRHTAMLSIADAAPSVARSIKATTFGSVQFCCGGPACIPNEPCGGGTKLYF